MIKLISTAIENEDLLPEYKTRHSSAADLKAAEEVLVKAGQQVAVATGIKIGSVAWENVPGDYIPELQVRARSGLAFKNGITLTNAVGTIDADYPDEIKVLLWNTSNQDFEIKRGDRIAQITMNLVARIPGLTVGGVRYGGFGSTGVSSESN